MIRRGTATLLLVISLASAVGCGGAQLAPNDEVTTRMNARDEEALDAGSPRHDRERRPTTQPAPPEP